MLQPKSTLDSLFEKAVTYQINKEYNNAIGAYTEILSTIGDVPEAHCNIATIYKDTGNYKAAIEHYNKAVTLNPDFTDAWYNLGILHSNTEEYQQALAFYLKALALEPTHIKAKVNLANCYYNLNDYNKAVDYYLEVLQSSPNHINANINLANIYQIQKNFNLAIEHYAKVYQLEPNNIANLSMYYYCLREICAWDNIEIIGSQLDNLVEQNLLAFSDIKIPEPAFANIARTDNIKQNYLLARNHAIQFNVDNITKTNNNNSKIKLGYLSADFYDHATMHLMRGIFLNHDRDKFEINIFSYGPTDESSYHKDLIANIDNFFDINNKSNQEAANLIAANNIDILIDLKGFTKDNRLGILALKPASIQITYLGYPGTTGADFIDYVITDKIVTPQDMQQYYSEKFLYLDCYQANDELVDLSIKTTKAQQNLPENKTVFCCFNQGFKIDSKIFKAWMEILKQVPDSILWLYKDNEIMAANLKHAAKQYGINPLRIIFAEKLEKKQHLARLHLADLMLDTLVYNGHTTTSDAIRSAVPVITVLGKSFAGRVAASILNAVNMNELVVQNIDAYIDLAVNLAQSGDLQQLKAKLKQNLPQAKLFQPKHTTKELENILASLIE